MLQLRHAAVFLLASTLPAAAQMPRFNDVAQQLDGAGRPVAAARATPIRIQVTYQLQWPSAPAASVDDQKSVIANSHVALYDLAMHECDKLKAVSTGDCRMVSMNINNVVQRFGAQQGPIDVTASASFEVMPAAASEPKP